MKTLSIKLFTIFVMIILFMSEGTMFYSFYLKSKENISDLLIDSIETNILNIKFFLKDHLEKNNIDNIATYLNTSSALSKTILAINLLDNSNKLLYSTDKSRYKKKSTVKCIRISEIQNKDIFKQKCYSVSVGTYSGLKRYSYNVNIYINHVYISSLLSDQIKKYSIYFILFFTVLMFLLWYILRYTIVSPLEKLRQFAYYSTKMPGKLLIRELESIRYSLDLTFDRMKKEQDELYKLSTQDSLSGLANRLSLLEKINWLISKGDRSKSEFAIIFLDLDNFKNINDSLGHEFGDEVLKIISSELLDIVRENDVVSRFGGDEFVVVLPDIEDETRVLNVAQRIKERLSVPIEHEHYKYSVTASIGITIYPRDGKDATTLLKNADMAMYRAKELGKNNYHFFTEELNRILQEKMHIQKMMEDGLEKHHFKLFYQPKVDIKTGKITGCEALIRLIDPKEGLIPPDKFIHIAEANNFIIPIGKWVIKEAISQIKIWSNTKLKDLKISINVSGIQFLDPSFIKDLESELLGVDPSKLDIELTESVLMSKYDEKLETIKKIKKLGLSLSLDDFGTGYSSLSYLKNIPFDTIKIDKSFMDDLESKKSKRFIAMIVSIVKDLNLEVVAEGVETKDQLEYLRKINCDVYQGYFCSKPVKAQEFEKLFV